MSTEDQIKVMKKQWKIIYGEECPDCGDSLEAFTDAEDEYFNDGDGVRCSSECGYTSIIEIERGWANVQKN